MSCCHYGIDPRTKRNLVPELRPIGPTSNNYSRPQTPLYNFNKNNSIGTGNNYQGQRPSTALARPVKYGYPAQTMSPRQPPKTPKRQKEQTASHNFHVVFDSIMASTRTEPLHESIERHLKDLFDADMIYVWFVASTENRFYSPTKNQACEITQSILSFVYDSNEVLNLSKPSNHKSYDRFIDSEFSPTLYIPIGDPDNHVFAIIQVFHPISKFFTTVDLTVAIGLSKKFSGYSHFLFDTDKYSEFASDIAQTTDKNVIPFLVEKLQAQFDCRAVEFWIGDTESSFLRYDTSINTYVRINNTHPGVIIRAFQTNEIANIDDCTLADEYNIDFDGDASEAVLAVPYTLDSLPSAIVLRGKFNFGRFTFSDELQLKNLTPLILKCLASGGGASGTGEDFSSRLKALLEVAEILSGVLDIDVLVPTIMDRACSLLCTERCSLFLVDSKREFLITTFHSGLDRSIKIPINRGIVGHTATTGEIVNISDAYLDNRFDQTIDKATGFRTKTILTVPIYNNRGEIAGVTEMINKNDEMHFNDEDIKMMVAFNVFCGISLDNARLYQTSLDLTRQLRGFVEMSSALNKTKTLNNIIEEILNNAKDVINAARATLFMKDPDVNTLSPFVTIGEGIVYGTKLADIILQSRKPRIFHENEILENARNSISKSVSTGSSHDVSSGLLSRVATALNLEDSGPPQSADWSNTAQLPESICCFPLLTSDQCILGVLELSCRSKILPEDIKLLDCFAVFAAVSLEKSELQKIASLGKVEVELKKYISDNERSLTDQIPAKLKIPPAEASTVFCINFDAPAWDGIGHFKVIWQIFDSFNLLSEYKITNEKFFRFLTAISGTYNKVPYHNWRHAVDVTQFVTYEIKTAKLEKVLSKFELFALLVSAICHDANHDGFTNVYNVKAETPLGILFKNQSVMETHHCSVTIGVISKEECNIFESLNPTEIKDIWNLIIKLILATDMAKHYQILQEANEILDKGEYDMSNADQRFVVMRLILKCGDISNVSRPFELADKWCDVLCDEFFRQGDLEKTNGMEYTSPLNDRAHLDKAKSQIGFYTYVCLPLYQAAARGIKELQVNVDQVSSNLEVWKANDQKNANEN
ncbi:3'5'-cyclic nucleotide phosphodiesterase family protein [Tritrichomonas foetus]|uniref:3'5'-cyclic nucleotide phosphodiesterase family protein n=1 Tax=Tritrichomonas foetus TaxID=1144522 RepID=A0A1J4J6N6_9EUKA|nr:3'5'-cyclic nucleotide phosphodiesterase family protein [Tritrichomonas foetus]|eukprot:OHS93093.1 3'5'-cyclic nucleotide phosphodiesterase family protein [Tritrichomonas foetus]